MKPDVTTIQSSSPPSENVSRYIITDAPRAVRQRAKMSLISGASCNSARPQNVPRRQLRAAYKWWPRHSLVEPGALAFGIKNAAGPRALT